MPSDTKPTIAFVWENFGPAHAERCTAVARRFADKANIFGLELSDKSAVYDWTPEGGDFTKITLAYGRTIEQVPFLTRVRTTLTALKRCKATHVFLCQYEHLATLIIALSLRLLGKQVYVMNDSKFDDRPRTLWREFVKALFYAPYQGALSGGARTTDYMRLLGIPVGRIAESYDSRSVVRIRQLAGVAPAPGGTPFNERYFAIVARFVPKKNLSTAIEAYRLYSLQTHGPRPLRIYGSGPLESELRSQVQAAQLEGHVHFMGFLQTEDISRGLGAALALILPSREEQFGNVVIEAQAMGVPVILSENCGARDSLIRSGVNGFVVEPHNAEGFAFFMGLLAEDEPLWRRMSARADTFVWTCDVQAFAVSVDLLIHRRDENVPR